MKTFISARKRASGLRRGPAREQTISGSPWSNQPATLTDETKAVHALYRRLFPAPLNDYRQHTAPTPWLSDSELINRAKRANDSGKFARLWSGVWKGDYPSQSEADLALCMKLAFWTGRDPARMDALFRESGLMRPKWLRDDYRTRTIETAIRSASDVWTRRRMVTA